MDSLEDSSNAKLREQISFDRIGICPIIFKSGMLNKIEIIFDPFESYSRDHGT